MCRARNSAAGNANIETATHITVSRRAPTPPPGTWVKVWIAEGERVRPSRNNTSPLLRLLFTNGDL
jgi:hypothetical protein